MNYLQLTVVHKNYAARAATRIVSLVFVAYISIYVKIFTPPQCALWIAATFLVEAEILWIFRNLSRKHAGEVDIAAPVELRGIQIFTAILCWLTAIPALVSPFHANPAPIVGLLLSVAGLVSIASQRDMRRWAFVTNAPAHAAALLANLAALATPELRGLFLLFGLVFIANTFTASETTSWALMGLVASRLEAARATVAKSLFVARLGHEIRTPLNGILGIADLMATEPLPPEQETKLSLIRQSGRTLSLLLNDLLDFSKIEAGKLALNPTRQNLRHALAPAVDAFRLIAQGKGLAFRDDLSALDATFSVDAARVGQIVQNLLSNAIKFTDEGEVTLTARRNAQGVVIDVSDTGPGLAEAEAAQLFKEFAQIERNGRLKVGAGLGLNISSQLAALMGGTVSCVRTEGRGATFRVELPLAVADDGPAADPAPDSATPGPSLATMRVLVAEDHPTNQAVISGFLKVAGVDFRIESDGARAVAAWTDGDWDLVLMDVQMPVMDGLDATRAIRSLEQAQGRPRTPIYGFSADAMSHQVAEQMAAGLDGHLHKPIQFEALYAILSETVAGLAGRGDAAPRPASSPA